MITKLFVRGGIKLLMKLRNYLSHNIFYDRGMGNENARVK